MKGYVKFSDGHKEDILEGTQWYEEGSCRTHHIMARTESGMYHKRTEMNSREGAECSGYVIQKGTPFPVAVHGAGGIEDIFIEDLNEYCYKDRFGDICGRVHVSPDASLIDIYTAILHDLGIVKFEKTEEYTYG